MKDTRLLSAEAGYGEMAAKGWRDGVSLPSKRRCFNGDLLLMEKVFTINGSKIFP